MKFRVKLTIVLVAIVLSLVGYGVLANALSVEQIMAGTTPTTEVGVQITG